MHDFYSHGLKMDFASTDIHSPGRMRREGEEVKHKSVLLDCSTLLLQCQHISKLLSLSHGTDLHHMTAQGGLGILLT